MAVTAGITVSRAGANPPTRAEVDARPGLTGCACASISPTTAPAFAAGPASPKCARCRAHSRRRSPGCSAGSRSWSSRVAPTPACTRRARWPTSTSPTSSARARLAKGRSPQPEALAARITGVLGQYPDVVVHHSAEAAPGFDARFSAVWRRYEYRIADLHTPYDPPDRVRTTRVKAHLDVEVMDAAARSLIGLHDFAAYCKWREGATTIRTLLER